MEIGLLIWWFLDSDYIQFMNSGSGYEIAGLCVESEICCQGSDISKTRHSGGSLVYWQAGDFEQ